MRSPLPRLAAEISADPRTLRRAVSRGTVRAQRPGERQLVLEPGERDYLRTHWQLLTRLSQAFRTEPNVSLAVLYGSIARGDGHDGSDFDLLVDLRDESPLAVAALADRLSRALGREVDLARLGHVRSTAPLLLLQALDQGRVIVDRERQWPGLRGQRSAVSRSAERAERSDRAAAAAALAELLGT